MLHVKESESWDIYNIIREVASTFRGLKSYLHIHLIDQQKDDRIEACMYLTLLIYQLVNTVRHMLIKDGVHSD